MSGVVRWRGGMSEVFRCGRSVITFLVFDCSLWTHMHVTTVLYEVHVFKGSWRDGVRRRAKVRFCKCYGGKARPYT